MVEVNPPEFLGAECYTFEDFRQAFNGVVCVEGVTATGDLLVTAAGGASVNVNVAAGTAWVEGNINGAEGMYFVTNGASVAVTIAANGAGSSRIDLILATVYDSQYIGAADQWAIEVVQGVAGAGVPAVPDSTRAGYLILGHVTVPASGGTPSVVSDLADQIITCGRAADMSFPYVSAKSNAAQSIPTGTLTKATLGVTSHIDSDYFSLSASVVTVLESGLYDLNGLIEFDSGVTTLYAGHIKINGLAGTSAVFAYSSNISGYYAVTMTGLMYSLTAGDTVQLAVSHSSGVSDNLEYAVLTVRKVG